MRWIGSVVFGLLLACRATAFDGYGTREITNRNATLTLQIIGRSAAFVQAGTLVSGTNVRFDVSAVVDCTPSVPPESDDWTIGFIKKVEIRIGPTALVKTWNEDPIQRVSGKAFQCRFASTWFPNETDLELRANVWCELQRHVSGQIVETYQIENEPVSVDVKPYNRSLLMATVEESGPSGFTVPTPLGPVGAVAKLGVDAIRPITAADGLRHLNVPGSYEGESGLRESVAGNPPEKSLSAYLKESTVFFAMTHGVQGIGFRASKLDTLEWFPDVGNAVSQNRIVPRYNFVAMYACSAGAGTAGAYRFDVQDTDRAYVGFTQAVHQDLFGGSGTLDLHAAALTEKLSNGIYLKDALDYANDHFQPKNTGGGTLNMTISHGCDTNLRLHFVYFSQAEKDALTDAEESTWYYIVDAVIA